MLAAPYTSLYQTFHFRGQSLSGQVLGATKPIAEIVKIELSKGRFVSQFDKHNFYCVIGEKLAEHMHEQGILNPLYHQIQVGKYFFTVIGIAKPWEPNLFLFADINDGMIIPLQASYYLSEHAEIHNVLFRLIEKPDLELAKRRLETRMKQLLPGKKVEFRDPGQIIDIVAKQRVTFTWLLGAIGGISLLVGGIGVMNIMLVSVVERRREIGIRMAVGAKRYDILRMFLVEAVILTLFGGIMGIIFGVGCSFILTIVTKWTFHLYLLPPILVFCVSVLVGILSGFYPALRASRLDPIQTLVME